MLRPPRVCSKPGCGTLTVEPDGRCKEHKRKPFDGLRSPDKRRKYNKDQPESNAFYKTGAWLKARAAVLRNKPLCEECNRIGIVKVATLVDHIIPYRERPDLGLSLKNLRPLCHSCHGRIGKRVGRAI